jgi:hypothetical protein
MIETLEKEKAIYKAKYKSKIIFKMESLKTEIS